MAYNSQMKSPEIRSLLAVYFRVVATATILAAGCIGQVGDSKNVQTRVASGTRLVTLGTAGGPLPTKDRTQAANLLSVNGTHYVIDVGDNVTRRIVQAGADF